MSSSSMSSSSMSSRMLSQMSDVIRGNMVMVVEECGKHYGFDVEEALLMLGIENLSLDVSSSKVLSEVKSDVSSKVVKEKVVKEKVVKEKVVKEKQAKVLKAAFALPYNGEFNADTCFALKGELYTQCDSKRIEGGSFCKACQSKADKNESGKPDSGTIKDRQAVGIFEYVDAKGKKPISYVKVMSKLNLTREQVEEEAGKFNMSINEGHFVSEEKVGKGRPKREKKVLEIGGSEEDLFATLVEEANKEAAAVEVAVEVEDDSQAKLAAKQAKEQAKAEERAAKKEADRIAKEQAKEQAKLEAEQKKEADRLAKEQAKEADRIAKEQAKLEAEQKKEADRIAKEQAKEADRLAKEQAKLEAEQKKEAAKQAKLEAEQKKEADRLAKEAAKEQAKAAKSQPKVAAKKQAAPEETDEADVVKKIEVDGMKYLKSKKTGIIYDYTEYIKNGEQVVVGQWNEKTNKIDFKAADSEESEDEYDDDDN